MTAVPNRSPFFFWATLCMLATVVLGFGPTYFWRTLSGLPDVTGTPALPLYLHVHGALVSAWFALPVVQSWLIARGRTDLHRQFGWMGVALALALIAASVVAALRAPPRLRIAPRGPDEEGLAILVAGDLTTMLVFFPLMLGIALCKRSTPEVHRRLMYVTSLLLIGPALARFVFVWNLPVLAVVLSPLTFIGALVAYDLKTRRRIHTATWWGSGALLLAAGTPPLVGSTDLARTFVSQLGNTALLPP